jgi:iron(III) transport system permease protein
LSLRNSAIVCVAVGLSGTLGYAALAYALARARLPGARLIDGMLWLPWVVPGILLGIALLWLVTALPVVKFLYGTLALIILVLVIKDLPIGTHMFKTSVHQISPDLELASRLCGAGPIKTFSRITVPLMKPMLVSIFVLLCLSALRDISTTVLLVSPSTRPLSILMLEYASSSSREAAAVIGVIISIIAGAVAVVARRLGLEKGRR